MELKHHSTFKMGGNAPHGKTVTTKEELREAVLEAKAIGLPFHIVGEGSNTIFHHEKVDKYIIKNNIPGLEVTADDDFSAAIKVGAGVHWDDVVAFAVEKNFSGIEALSSIPGSAGATPVQNVGAYGTEIKDVLTEVEAYDVEENSFVTLTNKECEFAYRDSIFKKHPGKYIVTSITLMLGRARGLELPKYPGVKEYFETHNLDSENPKLIDIRNAISFIRQGKLPDPSVVPNCGSFFKNAIINKDQFDVILKSHPYIPHFDAGFSDDAKRLIKIPTGWLLEQAGFKNWTCGNFKTHDKNALVMTHIGNGTLDELKETIRIIQSKVKEMFGIDIGLEANIVE